MSTVIKSGAAAALSLVKPLETAAPVIPETERPVNVPPPKSPEAIEAERLRAQVEGLEKVVRELEGTAASLREAVDESHKRGLQEGHASGLKDAEDREGERQELLAKAAAQACKEIRTGLDAMGDAAAQLARDCLDLMLGDAGDRAALVRDLIRHQVAQIDVASLLRLEVSAEDFSGDAALVALAAAAGLEARSVVTNPRMSPGGCSMTLQLGQIDLGLDQQWRALRRSLVADEEDGKP